VSHKSRRIADQIQALQGSRRDARYLGFFECFNRQQFFEAHEVLEDLWLAERGRPDDHFYKGLIQLAGAFVHLQKRRRNPACALFRRAALHLGQYRSPYQSLDLLQVQDLISNWLKALETGAGEDGLPPGLSWPKLWLEPADLQGGL
jgi:predicted metal-dependent hydrolase